MGKTKIMLQPLITGVLLVEVVLAQMSLLTSATTIIPNVNSTVITTSLCANVTCSTSCGNLTCHGSPCTKYTDGRMACVCHVGFRGSSCETDVDECSGHIPCTSRGTCINTIGSYRCGCLPGWTGEHCLHKDGSVSVPQCMPGYKGENCTDDVDECKELSVPPCAPKGDCLNLNGSYRCTCYPGWNGKNCSNDINECTERKPCRPSDVCVNTLGSFMCSPASLSSSSPSQHSSVSTSSGTTKVQLSEMVALLVGCFVSMQGLSYVLPRSEPST